MTRTDISNGASRTLLLRSSFACCIPVSLHGHRRCSERSSSNILSGSQIILYFVGGSLQFITPDLKAAGTAVWLPVSNTLAISAVAPFVGYLQDLFGKRWIALMGAACICVGIVILGTAHTFGQDVVGMALSGVGAGIGELTGLAGLAECVPVRARGYSISILTAFVVVFTPYIFYCQLLGTYATWRWTAWISLIYNGITGLGLLAFYHPHQHPRAAGYTKRDILKKIDYVGGALSIIGLTLILVALQSGGYTHPWKSAYCLSTLIIGIALIGAWIYWEGWVVRYPMVPSALFKGQRIVALAYATAFVGGMFFYSALNFLPLTWDSVYVNDPYSDRSQRPAACRGNNHRRYWIQCSPLHLSQQQP